MESYFYMSQVEFLPMVEKYYPVKLFVKLIIGFFCHIVRLIRILKKKQSNGVSIIVLHKIGDSIFSTHAIKKIVEFHQDKIISIICFPETKSIFQLAFPSIEITTISHNFFWKGRIATRDAYKILHEKSPEIIYDLTGAITSASLITFSSAEKIVGMNLEYFKPLYDKFSPMRTTPHLIDMYMDVVRQVLSIGNDSDYTFPLKPSNSNKVLIHPFAGWAAKEWGIEKYYELAQKLSSQYRVEFITEVNTLPASIKKEIQANFRLTETKSVEDLIENINDCGVFIGNDSGPVHIASFLGRPTFTIYGPTNPSYCKPIGVRHGFINKIIECSPVKDRICYTQAGLKCPHFKCMTELTVSEVNEMIDQFISSISGLSSTQIIDNKI
ncbi:MAG: hypothetical protein COW85_00185 [Ignavibacteria bacterium CG22_combo_CG10-13_8_21_14_all_37_15]|nr:MAG: hypothetical protein COW85_00185 [Ignavibacteria bacterium CG22_combo_CG10-13_8_21_14_all_37_15]